MSITPCRLFDTRPATLVGNRSTPLNAGEEFVRQVTGTNGQCTIPATATGISYNLTVPTSINGFLTLYPADATRPGSSSINPVAGEQVKANGGIVGLSATGAIKVFTLTGPVDALLDITGYFLPIAAPPAPDAYVSNVGGGVNTAGVDTVVTSVSVPAGSYTVSAKLYALATVGALPGSADDHSILCSLFNGATELDFTHLTSVGDEYRNLSLQGSATLAAAGTLDLTCQASGPGSPTIAAYTMYGISLTATAVSLHDQSPPV